MNTKIPKPYKPCPLKDCIYRTGHGHPDKPHCNYITSMMDRHAEVCRRGCPPGKNCIRYVKRGSAEAEQVQLELEQHGAAVLSPGKPVGAMPAMVLNSRAPRKISKIEPEERPAHRYKFNPDSAKALYDRGMNDLEIAMELGVARQNVRYWRQMSNLPSNYGNQKIEQEILRLHATGMSSAAIGRELSISVKTVYTYLDKNDLSSNGNPKHPGKRLS